jgi:hypothetical protein
MHEDGEPDELTITRELKWAKKWRNKLKLAPPGRKTGERRKAGVNIPAPSDPMGLEPRPLPVPKRSMGEDELAIEFLRGTMGPKGRTYLDPESERGKQARTILARKMREEAPDGWFTRYVAASIDPRPHRRIERKVVFRRTKGTPVAVDVRQRAEIAAFMHARVKAAAAAAGTNATAAWARNREQIIRATQEEFGVSVSTVKTIWRDFGPNKAARTNK